MSKCVIVSFRLGGIDGVSRVANLWKKILVNLGYEVRTLAGEGIADQIMPELAINSTKPPDPIQLSRAFENADLVVVENLLSIPLNLNASRAAAEALKNKPALLHHHDPPWQRPHFKHITELPPQNPNWRHIVINKITQAQMAERGVEAVCIYNPFETVPYENNRQKVRADLKVSENEFLIAHPTRALRQKNIPKALEITAQLNGTYWITGPSESFDDFEAQLQALLKNAKCRTIRKPASIVPDIYTASDLVVYPSAWEGFGLPPIEAAIYERLAVVGDYPVAKELQNELGFKWFTADQLDELKKVLKNPQLTEQILTHNKQAAHDHLSLEKIQAQLSDLLQNAGWLAHSS